MKKTFDRYSGSFAAFVTSIHGVTTLLGAALLGQSDKVHLGFWLLEPGGCLWTMPDCSME